MSFKLLKR